MLSLVLFLSLDIARLLERDVVAGERIGDAHGLQTFPARRDARPAWDAPATASLLRALDRLDEEGLEPERYHRDALMWLPPGAERDALEAGWNFVAPATFPHAEHVRWLDCANCHPSIFNVKKNTTERFSMRRTLAREFCGACHVRVAFPLDD